ncbi:fibronectin type III-like domain-contianing protein, partial [Globicatella sulfidifaciens]|uniref:fibronectin type III-like domain-contianing protein n=1 Tax=Globicatella sulfidifaciens TaxID=136093 RepID=UPI0023F2C796
KELKGFKKLFVPKGKQVSFSITLSEQELSGLDENLEERRYSKIKVIVECQETIIEENLKFN